MSLEENKAIGRRWIEEAEIDRSIRGAWVAVAHKKFPRTHTEAYELPVNAVPASRDYVSEIAKIRRNWYESSDFIKVLDEYFGGIERIPQLEKELLRKLC